MGQDYKPLNVPLSQDSQAMTKTQSLVWKTAPRWICCLSIVIACSWLFLYLTLSKGHLGFVSRDTSSGEAGALLTKCPVGVRQYSSSLSRRHYIVCNEERTPQVLECKGHETYSSDKEKCVGESKEDKEDIDTMAMGRVVQLGNMFNARKKQFFPEASLWNKETIEKVTPDEKADVYYKMYADKTVKEKMSHMDISASLSMDFLGGLVHVAGSAGYLRDKVDVDNECNVELSYHTTKYSMTMDIMTAKDNPKLCSNKKFTHVVTSVVYGLNAVFVFKRKVSRHESEQDVTGTLGVSVRSIPGFSISGKGSVDLSDKEQGIINTTSLVMYGDFSPEDVLPTTFDEAIKFYKDLPLLTGNKSNRWEGSQILNVHMTPITEICDGVDYILNEITKGVMDTTIRILDEMEQLKMKVGGLLDREPALKFIPLRKNLVLYKNHLENYHRELTLGLSNLLPKIRGGTIAGEDDLVKLLTDYEKSQFEFETSKSFLANRNREITAVGMLIETFPQRSNIAVADYESANDVEYIFKRDLVIVMNLNILSSINLTKNFLDGQAVDESGFWFNDETITGQVGYTLRNYGSFTLANVDQKNKGYLIKLQLLKEGPPLNIVAMINGQIVTENFEVPEPPHDLSIKEITHEGYTLKIRKSCGSVTGCIITSSSFFENQTVSKEFFFNEIEKEIIVTDLKAAHPYSVSVVFTTKVGVTQPCKEPMKMMTAPSSPPQDVRPIHLTTDSIMVSWSPPAVVGEGIETSSLRYMVKLRGKDGREEKIQTNGLNTSFHGLLDARQYQVEVKAIVTEQNTSKPVSESLPTVCDIYTNPLPPRVLPPLPVDVQQFAITIRWEGPRLVAPHAVILHYILEFGAMDEDGFEPITGNKHELVTNDSLAMVTGLAQGQLYFFRAKVVTSLGNSDFSQPVLQQTKLNQTKYEGLESKIIKVQGGLESKIIEVQGSLESMIPPIGSIVSWRGTKFSGNEVPSGWQRCDGSPISRGPLKGLGLHTPDLNGEGRFLRGGSDHQVGQLEDDSVEDHSHEIKDSGHTHQDNGHTHTQAPHSHWLDETGNSHAPGFVSRSCSSNVAGYLLTKYQYPADCMNVISYTAKEQPSIHPGHASIKSSTSGVKIGKMGGAKSGGETRPRNMRAVFIMRVE